MKKSKPESLIRKAVVILNKESLWQLQKKQGNSFYEFDSVKQRIYRGDDKPNTEIFSEQLEKSQEKSQMTPAINAEAANSKASVHNETLS